MITQVFRNRPENIIKAGEILASGGLVAIPTETVYGLAADALNGDAVAKIFEAKGRPADNPLIVHVAAFEDIERFKLVREIPEAAVKLAKNFWPGPLTIIMKKGEVIPAEVSAGLDTVAIRLPGHPAARAIIGAANTPLAAPSANLSGSPSPTTAQHVLNDLDGKIDAVFDGGACSVGVESTVITLAGGTPRLLRPGMVTLEELKAVLGDVELDSAVLSKLKEGQKASSPGMKYKHYAPKANVVLLKCSDSDFIDFVNRNSGSGVAALCCDEDVDRLSVKNISLGKRGDYEAHAQKLFDSLRRVDGYGEIVTVYTRLPSTDGVGLAVYNRLIRAAGFEVIDLEKS